MSNVQKLRRLKAEDVERNRRLYSKGSAVRHRLVLGKIKVAVKMNEIVFCLEFYACLFLSVVTQFCEDTISF